MSVSKTASSFKAFVQFAANRGKSRKSSVPSIAGRVQTDNIKEIKDQRKECVFVLFRK